MNTKQWLAAFALCTVACASALNDQSAKPRSTAAVSVTELSPSSASRVNSETVLEAIVSFEISNFDSSRRYFLAPLFDSLDGSGHTFNALDGFADSTKISSPVGEVRVRYPITREWRSGKLARPIRVRFFLMEQTGAHRTTVIGQSAVIEFATE